MPAQCVTLTLRLKENSWCLQQLSREKQAGEDNGTDYGLFGGVSQDMDLQSTIRSWRKTLRSKCLPRMYPLFRVGVMVPWLCRDLKFFHSVTDILGHLEENT